jgi:murein DD-endopeptidase MepM/ murein hydrolase activator NlpD
MEEAKRDSWRERLNDNFLLVIRHEDTFREVGSYRLSLRNIYLIFLGAFLALLILVMLVVSFTPLKRIVPGYGDIEDQTAFIKLRRDYKDLEQQIKAQQTYINAFRRLMTDDPERIQDVVQNDPNIELENEATKVIPEDSVFREKVENEENLKDVRFLLDQDGEPLPAKDISQIHFTPPVKGEVTARFMPENLHYGVDIMAPSNTPILATLDGLVITSDWTLETGHTLGILHDNNLVSFYKHNSANLKRTGEYVKAGEAVAIIGNSGTLTTGPHLHFELWIGDKAVDPVEYILFN